MVKRIAIKGFAILACALMFSYPTYSQDAVNKGFVDAPKSKAVVEGDQDILYKPPAVVEFMGIPFGMDIGQFSAAAFGVDRPDREYLIPEWTSKGSKALHPLLELVTRYGGGHGCTVFHDKHKKIVTATGGRNDFTANELRQFIDGIRKQYPELEEIKDKSKSERLRGTTKSGVSVKFYKTDAPKLRESDGELIYSYGLEITYEAAIKAEEDRQARIKARVKRKITESEF